MARSDQKATRKLISDHQEQSMYFKSIIRRSQPNQTESIVEDDGRAIQPKNSTDAKQSTIELKIPFQSLAVTTATTQISSLVFCLACATLDFTPQRDVWRSCIGLSGVPRYLIAYLYYQSIFKSKPLLWLHWIEITALVGLSIVDSIRYFAFHATCVGVFLLTSIMHTGLVCTNLVRPHLGNLSELTIQMLRKTQIVKKKIALLNFVTIVAALYLYDRHNRLCEAGVYSMFSFLEYIVIVLNITFHLQAYYDLSEYHLLVARLEVSKEI